MKILTKQLTVLVIWFSLSRNILNSLSSWAPLVHKLPGKDNKLTKTNKTIDTSNPASGQSLSQFQLLKKRLGVFLLHCGWDASPLLGYLQHQISLYPFICPWVEGGTMRVKRLAQEHNIHVVTLGRALPRITLSGVQCTDLLVTVPHKFCRRFWRNHFSTNLLSTCWWLTKWQTTKWNQFIKFAILCKAGIWR